MPNPKSPYVEFPIKGNDTDCLLADLLEEKTHLLTRCSRAGFSLLRLDSRKDIQEDNSHTYRFKGRVAQAPALIDKKKDPVLRLVTRRLILDEERACYRLEFNVKFHHRLWFQNQDGAPYWEWANDVALVVDLNQSEYHITPFDLLDYGDMHVYSVQDNRLAVSYYLRQFKSPRRLYHYRLKVPAESVVGSVGEKTEIHPRIQDIQRIDHYAIFLI